MTKLNKFHEVEQESRAQANRLLFTWLSDDDARADLYRCLLDSKEVLKFQSRAHTKEWRPQDVESVFHQDVYLLTTKKHVEQALNPPLSGSDPAGIRLECPQTQDLAHLLAALEKLEAAFGQATSPQPYKPKPPPSLHIRPPL